MSAEIPSSEWKPEERIEIAVSLASQLENLTIHTLPSRETVVDIMERIQYVLTSSTDFLEMNRQNILMGQNEKSIIYQPKDSSESAK